MTTTKESLSRFPKATRDNLHILRGVDGQHYIGLRDEGGYIELLQVSPFRSQEDPHVVRFNCGMTYFLQPLADEQELVKNSRLQIGIRDEHVMASAKVNDEGALLYLETREKILSIMLEQTSLRRAEAESADATMDAETAAESDKDDKEAIQ